MSDCALDWAAINHVVGPCLRPGGVALTARALEMCALRPGSSVADIGCGIGGTLDHLEGLGAYRCVGLDYSDTLLRMAASRLKSSQVIRGRAESLPFKRSSFHALFCECLLSILDEKETVLHEFARILKREGFLVLSDIFAEEGPDNGRKDAPKPRRERVMGKKDLHILLEETGFSVLVWEEHRDSLKEFVARVIFAGGHIPDLAGHERISYFLLIGQKKERGAHPIIKGDNQRE